MRCCSEPWEPAHHRSLHAVVLPPPPTPPNPLLERHNDAWAEAQAAPTDFNSWTNVLTSAEKLVGPAGRMQSCMISTNRASSMQVVHDRN